MTTPEVYPIFHQKRLFTDLIFIILTDLLFYLHPFDVLQLSNTCRELRSALFDENFVWLRAAENISLLHPLPSFITPENVRELSTEVLRRLSLRTQRIFVKWHSNVIEPNPAHATKIITYPDIGVERLITYFEFLPGAQHFLVTDSLDNITCWTIEGRCLALWHGVSDTTFCSLISHDFKIDDDGNYLHTVDLLFCQELIAETSHCARVLTLSYSLSIALFEDKFQAFFPNEFHPMVHSFAQGALFGAIVNVADGRTCLFMLDMKVRKALCFDIGIPEDNIIISQVLTSTKFFSVIWETDDGFQGIQIEMVQLSMMIQERGYSQEDSSLLTPIFLPLSKLRYAMWDFIPEASSITVNQRRRLGSASLIYPSMAPKWKPLCQNVNENRIQSVLTLSLRKSLDDAGSISLDTLNEENLLDEMGNVIRSGSELCTSEFSGVTTPVYAIITHCYWDPEGSIERVTRTTIATICLSPYFTQESDYDDYHALNGNFFQEVPVAGCGGRCAVWIQECEVEANVKHLIKLVMFPLFGIEPGSAKELPKVATLTLPPDLENCSILSIEVDEASGVVAILSNDDRIYVINYT